jgi:Domain of unknown function (DUF4349)
MTPQVPPRALFVSAMLVLGLLLASCSNDSGGSPSSAVAEPGAAAAVSQDAAGAPAPASDDSANSSKLAAESASGQSAQSQYSTSVPAGGLTAKRVRLADITVRVTDIGAAAARVRAVADRFAGSVSSEKTQSSRPGTVAESVLVLRVPERDLDAAIAAVAATGTEVSRSASDEDVTATLADLESRENSQRASVDRIRELMDKATSLRDVVLLESELSRRETDLEAAQASRRALADQAAQATLTVSLTMAKPGEDPTPADDEGFMAGLKDSWHAVQRSTTVVLTVLGALLPVAVLLTLIGWPAYLAFRRRRPRPQAPTTP